jgi:hypothetical protein
MDTLHPGSFKLRISFNISAVAARKNGIGAARCEYVYDVHMSKASKRPKVVPLHLWRINIKTTGGFINIPVEDFHMVKTASE